MKLKYSVGTDVDSKILEVNLSVIDDQQVVEVISSRSFDNTPSGHQQIVAWVEKNRKEKKLPIVFCMEATGVYHEKYALHLDKQGFRVSVILANKAKQYLNMISKSKNDMSLSIHSLSSEPVSKPASPSVLSGFFCYSLIPFCRL